MNVLTAVLALVGNLFYVLVYTRWLKRSTPQNIVIGGAAGAVPPLVGWAAATGNLTVPALFLFLIVFFWTPPHFWALALLIRRDYEAARIPMLPVVRGERATTRQILLYSLALVPITLLPFFWDTVGVAVPRLRPARSAAPSSGCACGSRARTTPARARLLFHFSLAYLALLFVAMALDPLVALMEHNRELERGNALLGWALFGALRRALHRHRARGADLPSSSTRTAPRRGTLAGPPASTPLRA